MQVMGLVSAGGYSKVSLITEAPHEVPPKRR